MKIKRIVSTDMHRAMRRVREELGPDAVILGSQEVSDGMEITAAIDYDPSAVMEEASDSAIAKAQALWSTSSELEMPGSTEQGVVDGMRAEVNRLRELMEVQMALIGWGKWKERSPRRATLLKRLTAIGLGADIAQQLANDVGKDDELVIAWRKIMTRLINRVKRADDELLTRGGIAALLGATGAGKTTTIAKLAAHFAMEHGAGDVALVSTDNYRIGAHDHLAAYGRIIGATVLNAVDDEQLHDVLARIRHKKLVLIDTAGTGSRECRLGDQVAALSGHGVPVTRYLVLPANSQAATLDRAVHACGREALSGCIVTKQDEAASLGGVLSTVVRHELPIAYVTDGQKVPENLHVADPRALVVEAIAAVKHYSAAVDDDVMALRFGDFGLEAGA